MLFLQYVGGDGSSIATLMKCYIWFGSLDQYYKWRVPYSGTYTAFAETVSLSLECLTFGNLAGRSQANYVSDPCGCYSVQVSNWF